VAEYRAQGFLVIEEPQISLSECNWCRKLLSTLIHEGRGRNEGRSIDLGTKDGERFLSSPQILQPSLYSIELRALSYRPVALAIAKQLLGPDATFAGDQAILKPIRTGGPTPWHQDEAFRDANFDYNELSIWIALSETTLKSGPMRYVPGSHLLGVLPHRPYGNPGDANTIECYTGFDADTAVVCPIPAGSMIIHDGRTVHGALPNTSDSERIAYILQYSTPPVTRTEFREFPWLKTLRKTQQSRRADSLLRGGIFPELLRIMRSDRHSHRHFISLFMRRKINALRNYFRRS
jgi:ectoine hydroxylase-related dioxygenase (phytanoyl-CoA dioxygenase family)